jgi:hypothetical protein
MHLAKQQVEKRPAKRKNKQDQDPQYPGCRIDLRPRQHTQAENDDKQKMQKGYAGCHAAAISCSGAAGDRLLNILCQHSRLGNRLANAGPIRRY